MKTRNSGILAEACNAQRNLRSGTTKTESEAVTVVLAVLIPDEIYAIKTYFERYHLLLAHREVDEE